MATFLLHAGHPAARETALGWLLDQVSAVRQEVARNLEDAAGKDLISPTMLRRMIILRNWLPEDTRPPLDRTIQICRRRRVECATWPKLRSAEIYATGIDGSGTMGVLARRPEKRKHALASLLVRCGLGVRDAWVSHGLARAEVEATFEENGGVDQIPIDVAVLHELAAHFLALNLETGAGVPFGLIDFVETMGLSDLRPAKRSSEELLEVVRLGAGKTAIEGEAFEALLATGDEMAEHYAFVASWFEEGDAVDAFLGRKRLSRTRKEAWLMEELLPSRRERWAEFLAWAAFLLNRSTDQERWAEFYAAARALIDGRPIAEIPLMREIATRTIDLHAAYR